MNKGVSFRSLLQRPAAEILRSVQPEALVQLDGITYHVGGLVLPTAGATNCSAEACPTAARLGVWTDPATLGGMVRNDSAFSYESHSLGTPQPRYEWTPGTRHAPSDVEWPPKGVALHVVFSPPASAPAIASLKPPPRDFRDLQAYKNGYSVEEIARTIERAIEICICPIERDRYVP